MTYEELYRRHYANGDTLMASLYKEICEVYDSKYDVEQERNRLEDEITSSGERCQY